LATRDVDNVAPVTEDKGVEGLQRRRWSAREDVSECTGSMLTGGGGRHLDSGLLSRDGSHGQDGEAAGP
jgi:hypothetical protein